MVSQSPGTRPTLGPHALPVQAIRATLFRTARSLILVITTTRGRAVAENRAKGSRWRRGRSRRYTPAGGGQPPGPAPDPGQVQLKAGQKHQVRKPHIGKSADHPVRVGDGQNGRADDDTEDDLDHHIGDCQLPGQLGEDR
jgi:hypothetical protein